MNELEIKKVPFMGTELIAARDSEGIIWAGVRWMCDGIGLSRGQRNNETVKIQKEKVLSKGARNLMLPTNGGNQEVLCLKLDFVPLWLAKINITPTMEQETPELAANLEAYQLKAKDVLAAAFLPAEVAQQTDLDLRKLTPELRQMIHMELRLQEQEKALKDVNRQIDGIRDIVKLSPNNWRKECRRQIVKIAHKLGGNEYIKEVHAEAFQLVDERAGVSLSIRLTNKRRRMAEEGVCKSKRDKLTKADVIADDAKLIEIYTLIIKEMSIKYGVEWGLADEA